MRSTANTPTCCRKSEGAPMNCTVCDIDCDEANCCRECQWLGICGGSCRIAILLEQALGLEEAERVIRAIRR